MRTKREKLKDIAMLTEMEDRGAEFLGLMVKSKSIPAELSRELVADTIQISLDLLDAEFDEDDVSQLYDFYQSDFGRRCILAHRRMMETLAQAAQFPEGGIYKLIAEKYAERLAPYL